MELSDDFLDHVKKKSYWKAGETVVVGISGGVDSMVLFELLNRLPQENKPVIVGAHINHHLRPESDEEEAFVKEWLQRYDVPVFTYQWPKSEHPKSGFEQEARSVRYRFFNDVARETGSHYILTAHHRDDQVETVLMRFVKGSSVEELTGIVETRPTNGNSVIRPLLPYSKKMLLDYAQQQGVSWREDESNQSLAYTRNRYRHHLIPELKKENPAIEQRIYTFSKEIEELFNMIAPAIEEELKRSFQFKAGSLSIDLSTFLKQDIGFQKIVLRRAFKILSDQNAYIISQTHIDLLVDWFVTGGPNTVIDLPQQYVARKEYDTCHIGKRKGRANDQTRDIQFEKTLEPGQWVTLNAEEKIGLLTYEAFKKMDKVNDQIIYLSDDLAAKPLRVRHRKPGDRMAVKGLNGSKKIKDIFIDEKTPLKERDEAWLVTDHSDRIIWLVNYKQSPLSLNPLTDTIGYVLIYENTTLKD